nr:hypothetical protein [Oceanococcus sp. HetDA_MAG_MS8]
MLRLATPILARSQVPLSLGVRPHMNNWEETRSHLLEMLERHYRRCVNLLPEVGFDSSSGQHLHCMCLYASVIELCPTIIHLAKNDSFVAVPLILRSMYEADIDLCNSIRDENYFKSVCAEYLTKMTRVLQVAHNTEAEGFLSASGGKESLREFLKKKNGELEALKKEGHRPMQIVERFEMANRGDEYISAYAYLCGHSHSDIATLEERHLRTTENGVEVVLYESMDIESTVHHLNLTNSVFIRTSGMLHRFVDSGHTEEIDGMYAELEAAREQWPEAVQGVA